MKVSFLSQHQTDVREFMSKAGQTIRSNPDMPTIEERLLRVRVIAEELLELADAFGVSLECSNHVKGKHSNEVTPIIQVGGKPVERTWGDLVEAADAVGDLEYVVLGCGVSLGIGTAEIFAEIHASNMTKFIDGHKDEKTGKWIKGPSYTPADVSGVLRGQVVRATNAGLK